MEASNRVYQIKIDDIRLDIMPSYEGAVSRLRCLAFADPKSGTAAEREFASFSAAVDGLISDPRHFATRHAVASFRKRLDIEEHRLRDEGEAASLTRCFAFDTEFDPSFEILRSVYWTKSGLSKAQDELRRLTLAATAFVRMRRGQGVPRSDFVAELLEIRSRNCGLDIVGPDSDPADFADAVGCLFQAVV